MKLSFLFMVCFVCTACTCRVVDYQGVKYSHKSFGTSQSFGELSVQFQSNGQASVILKNFANDQVSIIRELKETLQEINNLKK